MSRMSELDADARRVARVIPIRRVVHEPCATVAAAVLAERAALALMCAPSMANGYRAEIIRAAAAGDKARVVAALEAWDE